MKVKKRYSVINTHSRYCQEWTDRQTVDTNVFAVRGIIHSWKLCINSPPAIIRQPINSSPQLFKKKKQTKKRFTKNVLSLRPQLWSFTNVCSFFYLFIYLTPPTICFFILAGEKRKSPWSMIQWNFIPNHM